MTAPTPIDLKGHQGHKGDGTSLGVAREDNMIVFRPAWTCAQGHRRFTLAGALELVEYIELSAELGTWYAATDDRGQAYAVKLVGGRLYCDETPRDDDEGGNPAAPNFAWRDFQRAVKARAKTLKPEKS
jgi:hypothetical protein